MPFAEIALFGLLLAAPLPEGTGRTAAPAAAADEDAPLPLEVLLEAPGGAPPAAGEITVRWTIRNLGGAALPLASWQFPLDPLEADLFEVELDGRPVRFRGGPPPRHRPEPHELVTLPPGGSVSGRVRLSGLYDFRPAGDYSIRYRVDALAIVGTRFVTAPVRSNAVRLRRGSVATRPDA
ncbi:MAG: hypothetical protein AB7G12_01755 [Thermoanaerobaculia bacterium]